MTDRYAINLYNKIKWIFDNYLLKINKIITDNKKILKLSVLENQIMQI